MTHAEEQIRDFLQRLTAAERDGNADTLASLLDEDFVCVGPLGFVLTKPRWLAGYRTGDLVYQALTLEDTSQRRYGDTVIPARSAPPAGRARHPRPARPDTHTRSTPHRSAPPAPTSHPTSPSYPLVTQHLSSCGGTPISRPLSTFCGAVRHTKTSVA